MIAVLAAILLASAPALSETEQERANALMDEIRCVVCEGQPISESNAGLAQDMRVKVTELVGEGRSDAEVRDWIADRYGESALLRPRARGAGWFLWVTPLLLAAAALFFVLRLMRVDRNVNRPDPDA